jgi:hypothetical protein
MMPVHDTSAWCQCMILVERHARHIADKAEVAVHPRESIRVA